MGITLGPYLNRVDLIREGFNAIPPQVNNMVVLFLMSVTLDTHQLLRVLKAPWPVLLATLVSFVCIPLMGSMLMKLIHIEEMVIGIAIITCVPSTLSTASVSTRRAGGNDAVTLVTTLLTNVLCPLMTPMLLMWLLASESPLNLGNMVYGLILMALLPTIFGQLLRQIPVCQRFIDKHRAIFAALAQIGILVLIAKTAIQHSGTFQAGLQKADSLIALLITWIGCMTIHLVGAWIGWQSSKLVGFSVRDRIGVAFGGSQKTLPIGLILATTPGYFSPEALTLAVFPVLMYHFSQLIIDTVFLERLLHTGPEIVHPVNEPDEPEMDL
jgi:sodium/bile acid cotransporter 7